MDGDSPRSGFYEPWKLFKRVRDHQVDIDGQMRDLIEVLEERHAHREVGNEMPVHDIDMDDIRSRRLDHGDVLAHAHEIRR